MTDPKWITPKNIYAIHAEQLAEHGGGDGVRDAGLLESALARPQQMYAYDTAVDICALAAACGYGIAKNHPFVDGNKRVALLAIYTFLKINGLRLVAPEDAATKTMLAVASSDMEESTLASWLRENTAPTTDN